VCVERAEERLVGEEYDGDAGEPRAADEAAEGALVRAEDGRGREVVGVGGAEDAVGERVAVQAARGAQGGARGGLAGVGMGMGK
jgi:hypothetical protein